jgi:O-antigen/teichoic acid export membrane protein
VSSKAIIGTFGSRILVSVINLLLLLITTQFFGAEARGEISLFIVWITAIALAGQLFGGPVLVYVMHRRNPVHIIGIAYSFCFAVVVLIWYLFTSLEYLSYTFAQRVCWVGLVHVLSQVNLNVVLGMRKFARFNAISVAQSLVHFLILGVSVYASDTLTETEDCVILYVFGALMAYGTTLLMSMPTVLDYLRKQQTIPDHELPISILGWLKKGFFVQLSNISYLAVTRSSFFFVESVSGLAALGKFSTACSLAEQSLLLSSSIGTVIFSRISAGVRITIEQINQFCRWASGSTFVALLILALLPSQFYKTVIGYDFSYTGGLILLLIPGFLFQSVSTVLSHQFSGHGHFKIPMISSLVAALVAVLTGFILIPLLGVEGGAIVQNMAYFTAFIVFFIAHKQNNKGKRMWLFFPFPSEMKQIKNIISFLFTSR